MKNIEKKCGKRRGPTFVGLRPVIVDDGKRKAGRRRELKKSVPRAGFCSREYDV